MIRFVGGSMRFYAAGKSSVLKPIALGLHKSTSESTIWEISRSAATGYSEHVRKNKKGVFNQAVGFAGTFCLVQSAHIHVNFGNGASQDAHLDKEKSHATVY